MLDIAIIGSGPAAMTAALYLSRAGFSTKIYEKSRFGGALADIPHLANFPGYDGDGIGLADQMRSQAMGAGTKFEYAEITEVKKQDSGDFLLSLDGGESVQARAVLVATGSEPLTLDFVPSVPVSYCALCDAPLYKNKDVLVVGGGNSGISEAIHLAKVVGSVTVVSHSAIRAEKSLVEELKTFKNVKIIENTPVTPELAARFDAVFVCIGKRPATRFLDTNLLDEHGFIVTDSSYMSRTKGLFAAGDVRDNSIKQVITAAGEGASAAISIAKYLKTC